MQPYLKPLHMRTMFASGETILKHKFPFHMPQNHPTQSKLFDSLGIVAWNCRLILTSIPYIQHLIKVGYDVIILEEHWLGHLNFHC